MDIETKLDEDFMYCFGFSRTFLSKIEDANTANKCRAWLEKLFSIPCKSIHEKRCRNIYLSNLLMCMQYDSTSNSSPKLTEPFLESPANVDITKAMEVFGALPEELTEPDWLKNVVGQEDQQGFDPGDGRTYLATRTLPGGEGAMAYLAVSMSENEPRWIGGGEGEFDKHMERKFEEHVPPMSELEQLILRRKNPKERQKVLTFYDVLMQNIADELNEEVLPAQNETVTKLLQQLVTDLEGKGKYAEYEAMAEEKRRVELLLVLYDRIYARRSKIAQREEVLDNVEESVMSPSFFENSAEPEDKFVLPAAMWAQAINKLPNKKNMELLQNHYPGNLIDKLLEYLANAKEEIAIRLQRRQENIATQIKKEIRKDAKRNQARIEEAKTSCDQAVNVLEDVKKSFMQQYELKQKKLEKAQTELPEQQKLYEEMRGAVLKTQRTVEEEAERGKLLAQQINAVNAQTEAYQQVNDDSIRKTIDVNMDLMRNIKRLRGAITSHEGRLRQIKAISDAQGKDRTSASQQQFFFM